MPKVVIFSGAGISAQSGISTFRDSGGLWEEYKIEDICSAGCLEWNYDETVEFYDKRRADIKDKLPNHAHLKIKELQDKYPNEIKIITQNVDDMFEKAGCKDVLHLHGFLKEVRCIECEHIFDIGYEPLCNPCSLCGGKLRPNIVFFGESAPKYQELYAYIYECEMLVIIGTSGNVINTDIFVDMGHIKHSILNNLEPSDVINDTLYSKVIYNKATIAIDEIADDIERFLLLP